MTGGVENPWVKYRNIIFDSVRDGPSGRQTNSHSVTWRGARYRKLWGVRVVSVCAFHERCGCNMGTSGGICPEKDRTSCDLKYKYPQRHSRWYHV